MAKQANKADQITLHNNSAAVFDQQFQGATLAQLVELYFRYRVVTSPLSRKEQRRDLDMFLSFYERETLALDPRRWSPRLSADFKSALLKETTPEGLRRFSDRTINRILAHIKTFARWVHELIRYPGGNPMQKVKSVAAQSLLSVERALSKSERRDLLDAADKLLIVGGRSKDRRRYSEDKPVRSTYRPYRNRAIIYTLIETGMRRAAVTHITIEDVSFKDRTISTVEKGGSTHTYSITQQGLQAIRDYLDAERGLDAEAYRTQGLFLPAIHSQNRTGQLHPNAINDIWNAVCVEAKVEGKTPHSARHRMGRHIMDKTHNVEAVQRQLGHKNAAYSLAYSRITREELSAAIEDN